MTYSIAGDIIIIDHTEVDAALSGTGAGKQLVAAAVAWARAEHRRIMPLCPFAKSVFDKTPEFADVLDSAERLAETAAVDGRNTRDADRDCILGERDEQSREPCGSSSGVVGRGSRPMPRPRHRRPRRPLRWRSAGALRRTSVAAQRAPLRMRAPSGTGAEPAWGEWQLVEHELDRRRRA